MSELTEKKKEKLKDNVHRFFRILFTGGVDQGVVGVTEQSSLSEKSDIINVKFPCVVRSEGQSEGIKLVDKKTFGKKVEFHAESIGGLGYLSEALLSHYVTWAYNTKLVGDVNNEQ